MKKIRQLLDLTVKQWPLFRHFEHKCRFPGLAVSPHASLYVEGTFNYAQGCSINHGTNILIPAKAQLTLGAGCYVGRFVELGPSHLIQIGDNSSLQDRCTLVGDIEIGCYCLFSLNVLISSGRHQFDHYPHLLIRDQDEMWSVNQEGNRDGKVVIEDDCWIGINAVIMPGVRIGKGCVIGANSVVTSDIPPYSVAVGAPAKVVKQRLAFIPPKAITWDVSEHFPYFYAGVEVSAKERLKSQSLTGLCARNPFELALNIQQAKQVYLMVKSTQDLLHLCHGAVNVQVGNEFTAIAFDLAPNANQTLSFSWHAEKPETKLVIQKAWVV